MIVGQFNPGEERRALGFIRELAEGQPLELWPGGIWRLKGGKGWRVWSDAGGDVCVSELTAAECERAGIEDAESARQRAADEERLRELSRSAREMAPGSIGDGR